MSKICENCGNVIPDGVDVCPNCGREDYNELVVQDILNEMGIAVDKESTAADNFSSDEDFQLQLMLALENMQGNQNSLEPDRTSKISEPPLQKNTYEENLTAAEVNFTQEDISKVSFFETSGETLQADAVPVKQKNQNHQNQHPIAAAHSAPRKTRQNISKSKNYEGRNNAAFTGIIVGLIVAIILVFGIAALMLYQMGFFDTMSDEELLGTAGRSEAIAASVEPEVSEEPVSLEEEEDSAEEETELLVEVPEEEDVQEAAVEEIQVTKFELVGAENVSLYSRGETVAVNYQIEPEDALIEWISSDETVAVVDDFGTIQARRGGTCTITGIAGGFSIAVSVTCNFDVPVTVMDMNMEDITLGYEGQTTALYIDYDLTDEQIAATVWESTDPSVAEVDENGVVKAVANGTAVITAAIGEYTASCIVRCVNVTGNRGYNNPDSQYAINHEDVTLTRKGEYFQLTLTSVLGTDTPKLQWLSSDTAIATVSEDGVVTAVSDGVVDITTVIGEDQFRCIVRVSLS